MVTSQDRRFASRLLRFPPRRRPPRSDPSPRSGDKPVDRASTLPFCSTPPVRVASSCWVSCVGGCAAPDVAGRPPWGVRLGVSRVGEEWKRTAAGPPIRRRIAASQRSATPSHRDAGARPGSPPARHLNTGRWHRRVGETREPVVDPGYGTVTREGERTSPGWALPGSSLAEGRRRKARSYARPARRNLPGQSPGRGREVRCPPTGLTVARRHAPEAGPAGPKRPCREAHRRRDGSPRWPAGRVRVPPEASAAA